MQHRERGDHCRLQCIERTRQIQQAAVTDTITGHPEQGRQQRARVLQRAEQHQQLHRASLDEHVPAENQHLHLERPRGSEIGRPLKAEAADAEGGEGRGACRRRWGRGVDQGLQRGHARMLPRSPCAAKVPAAFTGAFAGAFTGDDAFAWGDGAHRSRT